MLIHRHPKKASSRHKIQKGPESSGHAGHAHATTKAFKVTEAAAELPHAALEVYLDHGHASKVTAGVAGAVSVLAATRGIQRLRDEGLSHKIEGVGALALATASGLTAFEMFEGHGHSHGHGLGAIGVLEIVHGAAEIAGAAVEMKTGHSKKSVGLLRMAKGSSIIAAQLFPGIAPVAHVLHLGTALAAATIDPTH